MSIERIPIVLSVRDGYSTVSMGCKLSCFRVRTVQWGNVKTFHQDRYGCEREQFLTDATTTKFSPCEEASYAEWP